MRWLAMGEANQALRFRRLPLVCECGRSPSHLESVGLTSAHELVIHWKCTACRQPAYFVTSLSNCWRSCPGKKALSKDAPTSAVFDFGPEDLMFLHSIRVRLPDDGGR
jgi:hypothetical protein